MNGEKNHIALYVVFHHWSGIQSIFDWNRRIIYYDDECVILTQTFVRARMNFVEENVNDSNAYVIYIYKI